jgi:type I restriction enzyme S subunit
MPEQPSLCPSDSQEHRGISEEPSYPANELGDQRQYDVLVSTPVGLRPKNWIFSNIGRWISSAEYGTNVPLSSGAIGVPVLRMNNIQDGEFDLSDLKFAPADHVDHLRLRTQEALLRKSRDGRTFPFPRQTYPLRCVSGVPRAVKRFRMAALI